MKGAGSKHGRPALVAPGSRALASLAAGLLFAAPIEAGEAEWSATRLGRAGIVGSRLLPAAGTGWCLGFHQHHPFELPDFVRQRLSAQYQRLLWAAQVSLGSSTSPIHGENSAVVGTAVRLVPPPGMTWLRLVWSQRRLNFTSDEVSTIREGALEVIGRWGTDILTRVSAVRRFDSLFADPRVFGTARLRVMQQGYLYVQYQHSTVSPSWSVACEWHTGVILRFGHDFGTQTTAFGLSLSWSRWTASWGQSDHTALGWSKAWSMEFCSHTGT